MRASWMTAALLGSILTVGCGGPQTPETTEDTPETAASAPDAPDAPASPTVDTAPAAETSRSSRRDPAPRPAREPDSRPGAATPAPARVEYRDLTVPANTPLTLELLTAVSSETAQVETPVRARLKQAISVEGYPVLPVGTELTGAVTEVAQAGRVKGRARVTFVLTDAIVGGAREKLLTNPVTFEAEATKTEDATKIGVGAGIGAAIGGILGGGSGAAKGAAIGGAAGTGAVLATKGANVDVAAGTDIAATLAQPFELRVRK